MDRSNGPQSVLKAISSLFSVSDEQLMWRVQTEDDASAFTELMTRWEGAIQRLCTRMTGDPHRGEDLCQEAFARLYAQRRRYQPQARLSTYLWRIAVNLCYDELRRVRRRSESSLDTDSSTVFIEVAAAGSAPDVAMLEEERAQVVRRALMELPETLRSVLVLRHYENLKFREIADVLQIPEGTVKSRMVEALSRLQRRLQWLVITPAKHEVPKSIGRPASDFGKSSHPRCHESLSYETSHA